MIAQANTTDSTVRH